MTRSYRDVTDARLARMTPTQRAKYEAQYQVLAKAYDIAVQLIELREKHGLTQAQLAERCGVDQGDISRIERGSVSPTARTLQRIGDALDADLRLVERVS